MKYEVKFKKYSERPINEENTKNYFAQIATRINGMSNNDTTARIGSLENDEDMYFFRVILSTKAETSGEEQIYDFNKIVSMVESHAKCRSW